MAARLRACRHAVAGARRPPVVVDGARSTRVERRGVADAGRQPRAVPRREGARGGEASERRPAAADAASTSARASRASIVCGAWNFGAGATVAVALPGAVLPNGLTLERRKVRGEVSDGMILAEDEVALGTDHAGIMLLDDGHEPGTPLADVLPLGDEVLVVDSTGNRPDLLSVYGIAREVAALYDLPLADMPGVQDSGPVPNEPVPIEIEDFEGCPRYIGRLFRDVQIGAVAALAQGATARRGHAPDLERRRRHELRDARARQPAARLRLRHAAREGSSCAGHGRARRLVTLDGTERALEPEDLMIADETRSIALAGIMGGAETEIGEGTTNVLLEAANFEPATIFRTAERLRMTTEGQNRWVKGVDPHLAEPAANLATAAPARAHAARVGRPQRRARRAARAAGDRVRARRSADALIGVATPPTTSARCLGAARLRASTTTVIVADLARARRDARGRPHRGGRALPARRRAVDAADARELFGRLTREQRLLPPRRGRPRRPRLLRGVHVLAAGTTMPTRTRSCFPEPSLRSFSASCARRCCRPRRTPCATTSTQARRRRALRDRARLPTDRRRPLPDEPWHLGAILEAASTARRARSSRSSRALEARAALRARAATSVHAVKPASASVTAVGSAQLDPRLLEGDVVRVRARPAPSSSRASRERVSTRT